MTNEQKFELCQRMAREIVARYRAEAPEGCDPQGSWVAVAGVAISAGAAAYQSSQSKSSGGGGAAPAMKKPPKFDPKITYPNFVPVNAATVNSDATAQDQNAFALSDADFKARHPQVVQAENAFQNQLTKDWKGNDTLMPALQATAIQSGLEGATGSMGPLTENLAPNSGVEADVAKNLGLDILNFQQLNRANRMQDLGTAESIFPRRQFGLTGNDIAQIDVANTAGQNNWNQANYANRLGIAEFNYLGQQGALQNAQQQANINAQAQAQQQAGIWGGLMNGLGGALKAYGQGQGGAGAGIGSGGIGSTSGQIAATGTLAPASSYGGSIPTSNPYIAAA